MQCRRRSAIALAALALWSGQPQTALAHQPGRLAFENGYPSAASTQTLYDELDLQRATQGYLWALPAVGFKALYNAQAKTMGVRHGDVLLYRTLQDKAGMLTPNITTL